MPGVLRWLLGAGPVLLVVLCVPCAVLSDLTDGQVWRQLIRSVQALVALFHGLLLAVVGLRRHRAMSSMLHQAAVQVLPSYGDNLRLSGDVLPPTVVVKLGTRAVHLTRLQRELRRWFHYTFAQACLMILVGSGWVAMEIRWWIDAVSGPTSVLDIPAAKPIERLTLADGLQWWLMLALAPPLLIWGTWPVLPSSASIAPVAAPAPPAPNPAPLIQLPNATAAEPNLLAPAAQLWLTEVVGLNLQVPAMRAQRSPSVVSDASRFDASPTSNAPTHPHTYAQHLQSPYQRQQHPFPNSGHPHSQQPAPLPHQTVPPLTAVEAGALPIRGRTEDNVAESVVIVEPVPLSTSRP
jgi:hypothetical protein